MLFLISCLIFNLSAENFDKAGWQNWKDEQYKNALSSPTSFLNATSLSSKVTGNLYLVINNKRSQTRWVDKQPKKYDIIAEHQGDRVRVQVGQKESKYLTPQKRRLKIPLKNGAIAEAVFGRRNGK
ncbi:MAG: hypothetical protein HRT44_11635, partial [Bdellovibrionales bacterium]|nr:hypothetical protein [Bdellovibrionales bacterium]NQZ19893.1 hypothetical protein [Bdellovibrionales bacterium]